LPVDKYFTDSSSFPLPANDPAYVTGRLKNYALKLGSYRGHKQLESFFQAICERAALDRQQRYLVSQVNATLANDLESGDVNRPTFRYFCFCVLFPVYVEQALSSVGAWALSLPILEIMEFQLSILPSCIDTMNDHVANTTLIILANSLNTFCKTLSSWAAHQNHFANRASTRMIIGSIYHMSAQCLSVIDLVSANRDETPATRHVFACLEFLIDISDMVKLAFNAAATLPTSSGIDPLVSSFIIPRLDFPLAMAREEFTISVTNSLRNDWTMIGDEVSITRGPSRRVVEYKHLLVAVDVVRKVELFLVDAARSDIVGQAMYRMKPLLWKQQRSMGLQMVMMGMESGRQEGWERGSVDNDGDESSDFIVSSDNDGDEADDEDMEVDLV